LRHRGLFFFFFSVVPVPSCLSPPQIFPAFPPSLTSFPIFCGDGLPSSPLAKLKTRSRLPAVVHCYNVRPTSPDCFWLILDFGCPCPLVIPLPMWSFRVPPVLLRFYTPNSQHPPQFFLAFPPQLHMMESPVWAV